MPTEAQIRTFKRWTDDPAPGDLELLAQWDKLAWRQAMYWARRHALAEHMLEDLHAEGVVALLKIEPTKRPYNAYIHKALKNKIQRAALRLSQCGGGAHGSTMLYGDIHTGDDPNLEPLDLLACSPSHEVSALRRHDIKALLASLKPRHQRILRLHYYEGLRLSECGAEMGITRAGASAALKAALKALKKALALVDK